MNIFKFFLNIFYPKRCMFCGKLIDNNEEYYCLKCYYKLPFVEEKRCLICGRELFGESKLCAHCKEHKRYIDANYPVFVYKGLIKEALLKYKFKGKMWYFKPFSCFLYEEIKDKVSNIDCIVYPPINKKTFYKRGYNQSELIAKELSQKLNIKMLNKCILKTRDNEKQSLMSGKMRYKNVKGVFKIDEKYKNELKGKCVLFIDDILTTGATADECAKMLKKAGALSVVSSTLCIAS